MISIFSKIPVVIVFFISITPIYPLARWFFPHIKNKNTAALLHFLYGVLVCIILFDYDTIYAVMMGIVSYYLTKYFSTAIPIIEAACFMYFTHILIYIRGDDWALDITCITMIMFQKIVAFAFNFKDGKTIQASKDKTSGRARWDTVAIFEMPSLLCYLSYLFTPYGSFSGPFFEYKLFEVILNRGNRKPEEITEADHKLGFTRFIGCFGWAFSTYALLLFYSYETYQSEWYLKLPLLLRMLMLNLLTMFSSIRYFPAWWHAEAGIFEFGIGSAGIVPLDELTNLSLYDVATSTTVDEFIRRWNHTTHIFWKNYLFTRLLHAGVNKVIASYAVFILSMVWHGLKFIYLGMLPETFIVNFADQLLHKLLPITQTSPKWITWFHIWWTDFTMFYTTSTWYFPHFNEYLYVRSTVYFLPTVISIIIIIVLNIFPPKRRSKEINQKTE